MTVLYGDTETYSEVPIKNGTFKYSENSEIMLFSYAFDDGPINVWDLTRDKKIPEDLDKALKDPKVILTFHNAMFDRAVLEHNGFHTDPYRWRCTMAKALAHGLPGSLATLSEIFNLGSDKAKDREGKKLIQLFCVPSKTGDLKRRDYKSHPLEWEKFVEYARLDIAAMREIDKKIPNWNYQGEELALWHLDQIINNRGFAVDLALAEGAVKAVQKAQEKLAKRTDEISLGDLQSTTQRNQTLRHILEAYNIELPDLTASTVERRMEDPDLPMELKELLAIRLQASSTSTAKYSKLLKGVSKDGRLRGTLQYCGASRSMRWGGRTIQPQNLLRPTLKQDIIDFGIEAIKSDSTDLFFDNVMELVSNTIRGCIVASGGNKLVISDLSSIEGRVLPWLAGERWKLDAYAAYDRGAGPDMYNLAYAKAFRIDPKKVNKLERQIGKVMELMLGFQGSVGAFLTGASTYKIDLKAMSDGLLSDLPAFAREVAEASWDWAIGEKRTYDLEKDIYVVCRALTEVWRVNHPNVVQFWADLQKWTAMAIENKGVTFAVKNITIRRDGNWLRLIRPSGLSICYAAPQLKDGVISYMGMNQYSRKWERIETYAGKLAENLTQSVARDILAAALPNIEKAEYKILLSVHDEVITEAPDTDEYDDKKLSKLLATNPPWAVGLPLAASGFSSYRYRKDG